MPDITTAAAPARAPRAVWTVAASVIVLDQITKAIVAGAMNLHDSIPIFGDWVRLTYIRNPGGAFGLRWGHIAVYYVSAVAVTVWIIHHLWQVGRTRRLSVWALALILGGAVGNLIDRALHGEVIDFIDVEFPDLNIPAFDIGILHHPGYIMDRWPVFNCADSAVTIGVIALLVSLWYDPVIGRGAATAAAVETTAAAPVDPTFSDETPT